ISATCLDDDKNDVQDAMDEMVEKEGLPDNVTLSENSQTKMMREEFSSIGTAIATAIFLIFLVMAIQFESPRFSLMVMLSIPFSLIGSFFLLFITGCSISMVSLMGILMLAGIVVNNGILYVDTANMLIEEQGMPVDQALVRSGSLRLRPILMTTLTTILSMVPMALGIGSGTKIMQGMALIIIGGLVTSTLLILLLLPSFYLIFYREKTKAFGLIE
ncbi:MAG: efflux RND transporter permease subunit, partial [Lachnospiraceae bacterium]|nr:efflux RND transporter permease subunit [Lachnospiraceae bacterium]